MAKDLTTSQIERQNVLNNTVALPRIQEELSVKVLEFEGRYVLTKQMVADYYGVDERTIERLLVSNEEELKHNGYFLCKGKSLKDFKLQFASDINVAHKTVSLGLFDFRSFLNIDMYLAKNFMEKMEAIGYHAAAGHIDRDLLTEVMLCIVNDEDYSESIKLELIEAMSKDIGYSE